MLGAGVLWCPSSAAAVGLVNTQTPPAGRGDFDGDGVVDYAYGDPAWALGTGRAVVLYGSDLFVEEWTRASSGILGSTGWGDYFADAIGVGDIDGDGFDDLAIGVPGDDVGSVSNAGSFHVIYGSSEGLTSDGNQLIHQGSTGIDNLAEASDHYGEFLAIGDFDCDGFDDVAVGIPREDLNAGADGGAVSVVYGSSSGLSTVNDFFHQNSTGVEGSVQAYDYFGAPLAAGNFNGDYNPSFEAPPCIDLAVGVPGEDRNGVTNAGAVQIFYGVAYNGLSGSNDVFFAQDSPDVAGNTAANEEFGALLQVTDHNGDGYEDLWVRVPGENCYYSGEGYHHFPGSTQGLSTSNDVVYCGSATASGVDVALADFETCVDAPEVCECDEFLAAALDATYLLDPVLDPFGCAHKMAAAAERCIDLAPTTLSYGATDPDAITCWEASGDAWSGPHLAACLGSEVEAG